MAKFSVKRKRTGYQIRCSLAQGEMFDQGQLIFLSGNVIPGLALMTRQKNDTLIYHLPQGAIPLRDKLTAGVSNRDFFTIVGQALAVLSQVRSRRLPEGNLVPGLDLVFYQESSRQLIFLYRPVYQSFQQGDFKAFFNSLVFDAVFLPGSNGDEIRRYITIVSQMNVSGEKDLESFLREVAPYTYNEFSQPSRRVSADNEVPETSILSVDPVSETVVLTQETELLVQEPEAPRAALIRNRDNQRYPITVNGDRWRFGKDPGQVDGFLPGNEAIGRFHGSIIYRNARWFVLDNHSRNGTRVNGEMLSQNVEKEVFSGDVLQIADEMFTFEL